MARGSSSAQGRTARSEFSGVGNPSTSLKYTTDYTKNMIPSGLGAKANDVFYAPSPIVASGIKAAVDAINKSIIPQKSGLQELYDKNRNAYNRYLTVDSQYEFAKPVDNQMKDLQVELDKATQTTNNVGNARAIVRDVANYFLQQAFLEGKSDFSLAATNLYNTQARKYGTQVAGELIRLGLQEGFDRMKRAGMTWGEKDPRISEQKNAGRVARSERPAKSAYNPDTQKIRMQAIVETLERKDLTQEQKAIISGEIGKGFRDKQIGLG
jgi:hypothetical protein